MCSSDLLNQPGGLQPSLLRGVAGNQLPPILQHRLALDSIRVAGHHDVSVGFEQLGGQSQRTGMVPRTVSDHAPSQLSGFQMSQCVDRAPKFESASLLQILAFEKQLMSGSLVERLTGQYGGSVSEAGDVSGGALDVRQLDPPLRFRKFDNGR